MSAAQVTQAGEELQLTAYTTLSRLIKAETNPDRLEKLLGLALRTRTPTRPPAKGPPGPPASPNPTPSPNRSSPSNVCEVDDLHDSDESDSPSGLLPLVPPTTFALMTDDEYLALEKQIGPVEAHRRRLIRAHLVANQRRRDADSS